MSEFDFSLLGPAHAPHPDHELVVEGLSVNYGSICALQEVSFRIGCGHAMGLLGQNGAGKSTLLKAIAGLNTPLSGKVEWSGRPVTDMRQEIAYLPQLSELDPRFPLTVQGVVELGRYPHLGDTHPWSPSDSEIVEKALTMLQLNDLRGRRLFQLSGGQLQRTQIARALSQGAHVLLLDEPFSGLDEPSQHLLRDLFQELVNRGRLLLVCHHDLKTVPVLFDTVLLLNREMVGVGPTSEVFTEDHLLQTYPTGPSAEKSDV